VVTVFYKILLTFTVEMLLLDASKHPYTLVRPSVFASVRHTGGGIGISLSVIIGSLQNFTGTLFVTPRISYFNFVSIFQIQDGCQRPSWIFGGVNRRNWYISITNHQILTKLHRNIVCNTTSIIFQFCVNFPNSRWLPAAIFDLWRSKLEEELVYFYQ
jgi:hypothetical protein